MKKNNILKIILIILTIIVFIILYISMNDKYDYDYEKIKNNSYIANDNSYLVLNDDKTFYWYKDKDNKNDYYYGEYVVYRGENAIKHISKDLSIYEISEEEQRILIDKSDLNDSIDHYYSILIKNKKIVENNQEQVVYKETNYYGFSNEDYTELDLYNLDANNYAIFTLEKKS